MVKVMNLVSLIIAPIIVVMRPVDAPLSAAVVVVLVVSLAGLLYAIVRAKQPTVA
jgi:hypothetical protein